MEANVDAQFYLRRVALLKEAETLGVCRTEEVAHLIVMLLRDAGHLLRAAELEQELARSTDLDFDALRRALRIVRRMRLEPKQFSDGYILDPREELSTLSKTIEDLAKNAPALDPLESRLRLEFNGDSPLLNLLALAAHEG